MFEEADKRYPLTWPAGWKRTPNWKRKNSQFSTITDNRAYEDLLAELGRLGARKIIISTNLALRNDGMPYAKQPRTDDEGVAVYFDRKGVSMSMACDQFKKRTENMRAITKSIEAIRGLERWGSSDLMERAFTGFAQLAGPMDTRQWYQVLGVDEGARVPDVLLAYQRLRSKHHPDNGGDPNEFNAVQVAWEQFARERGVVL